MNEAAVRVLVHWAALDAKTLEVTDGPRVEALDGAEAVRLADGFCPRPNVDHRHPPEQKLLVAPNGWAYCPVSIEWFDRVAAWRLEGVEGPEEGSGG